MTQPNEEELNSLVALVDEQLNALQSSTEFLGNPTKGVKHKGKALPSAPKQQAVIEKATGEDFPSFWQKYRKQAQRDLCLPGGLLHDQWKKWKDLNSKDAVKISYLWLAAMGIPQVSIAPVAVAATVFLLNVLINIGIEAVCEDCGDGKD
jgi:hypothetical protein